MKIYLEKDQTISCGIAHKILIWKKKYFVITQSAHQESNLTNDFDILVKSLKYNSTNLDETNNDKFSFQLIENIFH